MDSTRLHEVGNKVLIFIQSSCFVGKLGVDVFIEVDYTDLVRAREGRIIERTKLG
jgi:hypothetical protein